MDTSSQPSLYDPATGAPVGARLDPAAYAPGAWAGGSTRAIYADPPGAASGAARMWAGTATIERAAAYSFFPGRTRIHIPISGNGIRLRFEAPAELVELATLGQHQFDGGRPLHAEPIDGPIAAFNLIVRADVAARADVLALDRGGAAALPRPPGAPAHAAPEVLRLVYVVRGAAEVGLAGAPALALEPDDTCVIYPRALPDDLGARIELRGRAPGTVLVVATLVAGADS